MISPRPLNNRFSGSRCSTCRESQDKGALIYWYSKGCFQCGRCQAEKPLHEQQQSIPTQSEEKVLSQSETPTPSTVTPDYTAQSVDDLRKLCRERGLNGTTLLSLSKAQLVEFLTTGAYTPKTQTSEPQAQVIPAQIPSGLEATFAAFVKGIAEQVSPKVDIPQVMTEEQVKAYLDEQIGKYVSKPLEIHLPSAEIVKFEKDTHESFAEALRLAKLHGNLLLVGPAGTGKTTIAEQIAEALSLPYGCISCTAGMSEGHLLGRMNAQGEYIESEFVRIYEQGGVFCFDEFDAMDSNTALIINTALANGHLPLPNRKDKPSAKRHENFLAIACANTFGTANSIEYAGRNQLDAATLDRFGGGVSRVYVDYDPKLERKIAGQYTDQLDQLTTLRRKVAENKLRRIVGTRAVIAMSRELAAGTSFEQFKTRLLLGWSDTEKAKVA